MAETRATRSKGKKLDSIISKLKVNTPVEEATLPNERKNENVDSGGEADVVSRRSKRKPGKILRYRIDDDEDEEREKLQPENNSDEDKNTSTNLEDDSLPKTIFEELPNGEADFEEGEDTTVLFLPSEEIQVKAGPSDDYCHGLLDDHEVGYEQWDEEEEKGKEKKRKKKKSKSYDSDESLDEDGLPRRVICTACGRHVNPAHGTILRHPVLNVLVCKKCNQYYNSGPFTRDEYGIEEQCRWCGDGGDLICCDECEKVYCKPCIQRNCGKTYLKNLLNAPEDFKWLCIVCNKDKPLRHIQRLKKKCELVMEALDNIKARKAHFKSKKGKQSSVAVGPTPLERRSRLTYLSEDIGIKGEGFSSSGESPTKKCFPKDDLPAELFSKTESEEENENVIFKGKKKNGEEDKENGKENKKDKAEEASKDEKESEIEIESEKEKDSEKDEEMVDHLSSEEIEELKESVDVDDDKHYDETPADNTSVSQEEGVELTKKRISSRKVRSSDKSIKSDDIDEEDNKSNASSSSKKGKVSAVSSDQESTGKRKTRSQKDVNAESGEKEMSVDEVVVDQEQATAEEKKKKNSTMKKQKSIEIEGEDGSPERRVTRSRKEPPNKEQQTKKKKSVRQVVKEELSDKDMNDEEMNDENEESIQESSSGDDEETKRSKKKRKEKKGKKDGMTNKVKQELGIEALDSSEDFVVEKRPARRSKENANNVLQTKSGATEKETKKNTASKKEIILIDSSEEEEKVEKARKGKGKGKEKNKVDETSVKQKESKADKIKARSLIGSNRGTEKKKDQLQVKKEDSSSYSESENDNVKKRKRKESSEEESIAEDHSEDESIAEEPSENELTKEETSDNDSESGDERIPLKKRKQTSRKKPNVRESSSESGIEKKKKSRKTNINKKKGRLDESSESESGLSSNKLRKTNINKKKKRLEESSESESGVLSWTGKKKTLKNEEEDYILDESSESDTEKTSEESEESDSDQEVKTRRRGRGLQKQTRKRPRPIESSSGESQEQRSEDSDVGIARRTRKGRQEECESSDLGTKKRKKTNTRGKKSEKEKKRKNSRKKRRKNALDSDEDEESEEELSENKSEGSSESEEEKPKSRKSKRQKKTQKKKNAKKAAAKAKRRRRIRKNSDSDSKDDDDDEEEDELDDKSPRKGRKKIRKLLTDEKLGEETQKARRLEEERRKRLLERTRILEDEEMPKESWRMSSLVLEKDDETKEPLVQVHKDLIQHLKPHQAKGIQFMYNNVVDTIKAYKKGDLGGGCILAHCMGLGKTLQVVSLIHTLFNSDQLNFTTALVIAPLNTVLNWQVEFDKWLGVDDRMEVFVLKEAGANNWRRADMLKQWQRYGGVMILGYDMYRNLAMCNRIRSKHQKKIFKQTLVDPGPDLVVCDEGHILRNDQSAISKAVNDIKTKRRIVLTGTPLQNNLIEYHCMMSFVKPNLLGTRREFMNTFGNPILNGQCADSTPIDVRLMKQRCHVLYKLLEGCVQRRDYSVLTPFLPPKHEYVLKIRLSEVQRKLYQHYLNTFVYPEGNVSGGRGASLFSDYQALMRIWTHPWCLKLEAIRRSLRASYEDTDDSLDGFVVHSDEEEEESEPSLPSDESLSQSEDSDEEKSKKNNKNKPFQLDSSSENESEDNSSDEEVMPQPSRRATRSQAPTKTEEPKDVIEVEDVNGDDVKPDAKTGSNTRSGAVFKEDEPVVEEKEWYDEFLSDEDEYNVELSGKMALLLEILADAEAVEEKVLVFSQSLVTLDLIERALGGGEVGGDRENWCRGCDYFRMDGSTSVQLRQRWSDIFNDVDNKTARLFLISTKAGGLGINLVAANRVIVFDVSWNPSHDVQSIFRVFRFGQTRPVYVYRLVTQGTMEEKIYERQIAKLSISERVIDKHQIERHFTAADLAELYNFNPEVYDEEKDNDNLPKLPLPKDAVLADIINRMHPKWIVKYHEHDSLLQNVEGEELTEEERQMAWSAYEAQKDQAKNQERIRALQAAYAQQQLQQQRQAIPQNAQYNNNLLLEMQQLQQQQISERMSRYQADVARLQQEQQQRFMTAQNQNPLQQARTDQLRHQLLQHVGANHPVYPVHAQPRPAPAAPSYQPMMSYLSQQQRQQQHVLGQRGPVTQVAQLPQSQPLSHPRPTAPPMTVHPHGSQYRR